MSTESVHLVSTLLMAGLILFVQVVHYPLMAHVGERYREYQRLHMRRTGIVVGPLMIAEAVTAFWLALHPPSSALGQVAWAGVGLLGVIWASTALLQAPAHGRLVAGFDESVHRRLVRSNWIRTVAWLARVPVAIALVP